MSTLTLWLAATVTAQVPERESNALHDRVMALERMVSASGKETLEEFLESNLADELRQQASREELLALLGRIRKSCARAGGIMVQPTGPHGVVMVFETTSRRHTVRFAIQPAPPHKIVELVFEEAVAGPSRDPEPMSWDTLEARLQAEAEAGFSGVVLLVRDGEVFLHEGFGFADRKRRVPNTVETLFAIGSLPIDFTRAAILELEEMGRLKTSDPISNYIADVPSDKHSITLDHLLQSSSGLPNFHHIPGQDEDYDLTWIDRDEALRRILGKDLLFPPGQDTAHSHSAWTLLAAVVEIASGMGYGEFLQQHLFAPLGMRSTGLYPLARTVEADRVAVGEGPSRHSEINSPAHWGQTSWLVMGSGGMVSTPGDLHRWVDGIRAGKLLSEASQDRFWGDGVLAGGNDRGFLCMYTQGPTTMMFLCSNSHASMGDQVSRMGRSLARLVMSE